jgi:mannose-6-phosphate isomerase-like protein (cupin superfamily)
MRSAMGSRLRPARRRAISTLAAMPDRTNLARAEPFVTADGSTIREVAGAVSQTARNQSLAEATVPAGSSTVRHHHVTSEEIYLFTAGSGRMELGAEEFAVGAGDCVVIPPGVMHGLTNPTAEPLVLLCACAPAYADSDTVLAGADSAASSASTA